MRFENRRWIFLPATEVDNINFDQVIESNKNMLRYSQDGNTTFVKYEGVRPDCYDLALPLNEGEKEFNHTEALSFLNSNDWNAQRE